jgi:predicted deacetylase
MNSAPAQYLVRLDDFCPTMLREPRERFLSILARHGVSPILAVVPDNQDPDLDRQSSDPEFWHRMRSLQAAGATIALHGYRHLCTSRGKPLLKLHKETEFAGLDLATQQQWLRSGLAILRAQGLHPRLFVAPRHGFDRNTLRALGAEGLGALSDGFARRPFTQEKILWLPQQLWEPVAQKTGLWTICIHTNTAPRRLEEKLESFLAQHARQFTTFDQVASAPSGPLRLSEQIPSDVAHLRIRIARARSRRTRTA